MPPVLPFWSGVEAVRRTLQPSTHSLTHSRHSASVGLYAIQLASLYGFEVITTCSPRHTELVRSYGAKHVFDYRDEKVTEKIQAAVPNLKYSFDTIGNESSSTLASKAALGSSRLCTVRPGKAKTQNVTADTHVTDVLVFTAFLKDHNYGKFHWPVSIPLFLPRGRGGYLISMLMGLSN